MVRTERDIIYAFNRLLTSVEVEKITTQMIADEAGIGRATFYRYFKDKYDVLNRNYKELLDNCIKRCDNYRDLFINSTALPGMNGATFIEPFTRQALTPLKTMYTLIPNLLWNRLLHRTETATA